MAEKNRNAAMSSTDTAGNKRSKYHRSDDFTVNYLDAGKDTNIVDDETKKELDTIHEENRNLTSKVNELREAITQMEVQKIDLNLIVPRPVNEFHKVDNLEMDYSIKNYGLFNPIIVYTKDGNEKYTITAGESRYNAFVRLHEEYGEKYSKIDCKVLHITNNSELLEKGFPYITEETEERIYKDSNNLTRQLNDSEIARKVRDIATKLKDKETLAELKEKAEKLGWHTYSKPDTYKIVHAVIGSDACWSREKIRQYMIVYDANRSDLLDAIEKDKKEDGYISVQDAYKKVNKQQVTKRKKNTNRFRSANKDIKDMLEIPISDYSDSERNLAKECFENLKKIVEKIEENEIK